MQRVIFSGNRQYKPSIEPASDKLFIPLAVINDLKAQKNGTKKTVFWVKKKEETRRWNCKRRKMVNKPAIFRRLERKQKAWLWYKNL